MLMIDCDNMLRETSLTKEEYALAKQILMSKYIKDSEGEDINPEEYISTEGDLILEEDMYSDIKEIIDIVYRNKEETRNGTPK